MEKINEDTAKLLLDLRRYGVNNSLVMEALERINSDMFSAERFINVLEKKTLEGDIAAETVTRSFALGFILSYLNINKQARVLEIGAKTGYQTAILGLSSRRVYSLCEDKESREEVQSILDILQIKNATLNLEESLNKGWRVQAPFDGIIINEPIFEVAEELKQQLKIGGNLIAPTEFDDIESHKLMKITRISESEFKNFEITPLIKFVML